MAHTLLQEMTYNEWKRLGFTLSLHRTKAWDADGCLYIAPRESYRQKWKTAELYGSNDHWHSSGDPYKFDDIALVDWDFFDFALTKDRINQLKHLSAILRGETTDHYKNSRFYREQIVTQEITRLRNDYRVIEDKLIAKEKRINSLKAELKNEKKLREAETASLRQELDTYKRLDSVISQLCTLRMA